MGVSVILNLVFALKSASISLLNIIYTHPILIGTVKKILLDK